jgi:hypothetical protein
MKMKHFLKDVQVDMDNKGEEILISIKGDEKKLSMIEKKLKAMQELCGCCHGDEDSCC